MSKIDTSKWREFLVGDLFDAERGKIKNLQNQKAGDIPVIAAGGFNQGIAGMFDVPALYENKITISCNGAGCGSVFYHPYKFNLNGDAIVLTELNPMSDLVKQFISCMLNGVLTRKYSYAEKCSAEKAKSEKIKLPVDIYGNPNFAYMEEYMQNLESAVSSSLTALRSAKSSKVCEKLDIAGWRKFKIEELFEKLDLRITKSNFNKKLDVSECKNDEFSLPLVNAKHFNNGIMYYGRESDFETDEMTIDIVKNGAIATGDVYAQPQKTGVLWDAYLIKPKEKVNSELVLLFLATVLRKTIKDKFSYDDKCIWEKVKKLNIRLPINENKKIDYTYMEEFMKKKFFNCKDCLSVIATVCN